MTWIIEFRGDLSETSELNMDGSATIRAVTLIKGDDLPSALTNLMSYTLKLGITPTTFIKCEDLSTFSTIDEPGYTRKDITTSLKALNTDALAVFSYAISSEAEGDDDAIQIGIGS